ncbi:RND family efflux transporter MFP subunit [Candidatus Nitrosoglobus terrae]|uniref:RND family efflux transporter MFP subunit n=1 Tax=Candidatus Nitrosoglobus terrae TaxID=1630141 RepID=A0A1Q2SLF9_9GAMM|nr:efflux RND transporter periplasmic adaptor subunit [Candidatus Nitrosoglobus terrae]BAW79960.1 RND family efflux transporter MFP subunit [Candidatus Nitrosoglobus terrae]
MENALPSPPRSSTLSSIATHSPNIDEINQVLGLTQQTSHRKRWRIWVIIALALTLAGTIIARQTAHNNTGTQFNTSSVQQGNLIVTVTATGTLKPVNQVDVGSELSGTIETVVVDYNDHIKQGQILARLNTDRLQTQVIQAQASLDAAKASLQEAQATVLETRLRFERCQKLAKRQLCSLEDLDTYQAAYARGQAIETSMRAQIAMARATLSTQETDLKKMIIRSPIDGIVLTRGVEPGQTVAASFQTPVLFTLAESLTQMVLYVNVDEADIGQVNQGQQATFTVDAYPDRIFPAQITQVRYGALEIEGVITYETLLSVDNSGLLLRPGMTATADIVVKKIENALLIPNKALRFTPPIQNQPTRARQGLISYLFPFSSRATVRKHQLEDHNNNPKQQPVWIMEDGQPLPIPVTLGATDGTLTQVLDGEIKPSMDIIVEAMSHPS